MRFMQAKMPLCAVSTSLTLTAVAVVGAGCKSAAKTAVKAEEVGANQDGAAAFEDIPRDEEKDIEGVVNFISGAMAAGQTPGKYVNRFTHPKTVGCVAATFTVNGNIAEADRIGLFKEPATYKAWIRYSNFNAIAQADTIPDNRGMSIKLLDVPGERLQKDEHGSQNLDLVLTSGRYFMFETPKLFLELLMAQKAGKGDEWFANHPRTLQLNGELVKAGGTSSFFDGNYGTHVPYLYGSKRAAKFFAEPCSDHRTPVKAVGFDALAEQLKLDLASGEGACFDFYAQFFHDKASTPIEDDTIDWTTSTPVKLARITVPRQDPGVIDGKKKFCENLSFSAWRTLPEHQPLGGVARLRRKLYPAASAVRHRLNGLQVVEPTAADFPEL